MIGFIHRTLATRTTPLAYVYTLGGLIYGVSFTIFPWSPGVANTILFKHDALVGISLWGGIALIASIILFVGLFLRNKVWVGLGSFGMFLCWAFAAMVYLLNGYYLFLLPLSVINMLAYGYFYLAGSLDQLWDYTP